MRSFETWQDEDREAIFRLLSDRVPPSSFLSRALEVSYRFEAVLRKGDSGVRELAGGALPADSSFRHLPSPDPIPAQLPGCIEGIARRIEAFYRAQPRPSWFHPVDPVTLLGQKHSSLRSVAVSLPPGHRFPASVALLHGIPARLAGVREIVINVPRPLGTLDQAALEHAAHLMAPARLFGLPEDVALFAFAAGTESIPRVDKIFGLASEEGQAAALVISRHVGLHLGAASARTLILADATVDAGRLAHDLLARLEIQPHELLAVLTPSMLVANELTENMTRIKRDLGDQAAPVLKGLEEAAMVITTRDLDEALDLVNRYPPPELVLMVTEPFALLTRIRGAGCIRMGQIAPPLDQALDPTVNGILPFGSSARYASPPDLASFGRSTTLLYQTRPPLEPLEAKAAALLPPDDLPIARRSIRAPKKAPPA